MKRLAPAICAAFLLALTMGAGAAAQGHDGVYGPGPQEFSLATGSPGELGLLKELGQAFGQQNQAKMLWKKAGSGESLKLLKDKQVDMIMVHAPKAEKAAMAEGWARGRALIGSNEFYLVGPPNDPAGVAKAGSVAQAYAMIAQAQAKFFSRGDNSGTHQKEMAIWKNAGIEPSGDWYAVSKGFMLATLQKADAEQGYFMTDSSTWAQAQAKVPRLKVLFRGDKFLINTYHALAQPSGATPGADLALRFIDFVASQEGQKIIADFGKKEYGQGLYNDAAYAKQYDD